jgi:hypothetical protein
MMFSVDGKAVMKSRIVLLLVACCLFLSLDRISVGQTIFRYSAFQGGGKDLPKIADAGGAGNDGTGDATTKFSNNIPAAGVPSDSGNRSIDGQGKGGVVTGGTAELLNSNVAAAGGFTMETWFRWNGGGSINALIDYAGTEKLVVDTNLGTGNEVRMRINSDSSLDSVIGQVQSGQWHYVASVFDTQGNAVQGGSISGIFRLYLDGVLVNTTQPVTISDFGDSLNRPIGIAKHPLNFAADRLDGLIYEPRVSLGALSRDQLLYVVPEPSAVALLALGLLCLGKRRPK